MRVWGARATRRGADDDVRYTVTYLNVDPQRDRDRGRWGGPMGSGDRWRVERPASGPPGTTVTCGRCGQAVGYPEHHWVVADASVEAEMGSWVSGTEVLRCFACLLDEREGSEFNLRKRIGLPDDHVDTLSRSSAEHALMWARLSLQVADWWQAARPERPWVTLRNLDPGGDDHEFEAWWDEGDPDGASTGHPPTIEIRGCGPTGAGRSNLPGAVATVGWWLLEGFGPVEARRWTGVGVMYPERARQRLGWLIQTFAAAFPEEELVTWEAGHWRVTPAGFGLLAWLRRRRIHDEDSWRSLLERARSGRSLDELLQAIDTWAAFSDQRPGDRGSRGNGIMVWLLTGLEVGEAARWREAGISESWQVLAWRRAGMDLEEAVLWRAAGFGPDDARSWKVRGLDLDDALRAGAVPEGKGGPSPYDVMRSSWRRRPVRSLPARFRYWWREGRFY